MRQHCVTLSEVTFDIRLWDVVRRGVFSTCDELAIFSHEVSDNDAVFLQPLLTLNIFFMKA